MTLEEAIKHAEEVAEEKEIEGKLLCQSEGASTRCLTCAKEQRQLAEWLKELKKLREQTRWISASERPPEESGNYLVVFRYGWIYCREVCYFDGHIWAKDGYDEIVKWQYLPST